MNLPQERSNPGSGQLSAFDGLVSALARGLDLRDVFQQLCLIASGIVPHDEAFLLVKSTREAGPRFRSYASTHHGLAEGVHTDLPESLGDISEPRLLDRVPGPERGMRSGLTAPIRVEDRVVGVFALLSGRPQAYASRDLAHAVHLATYLALGLAHERLAAEARDAAVERARLGAIESSLELLRTISDVLDIRTVFARVSEIANKMLPHDALTMAFVDQNCDFRRQAASPPDFPELGLIKLVPPIAEETVTGDLTTAPLPLAEFGEVRPRLMAAGYRSILQVTTRAREQGLALAFWSKRPAAFEPHHVPVARRIADHVALAVSHEQLAETARLVAEARARAEQLEARVRLLSDELESKTHVRIIGTSPEWRDVLKRATQVAATEATVLVSGESGTGKEVVARFIHRASARSKGPFIALNCAALPEQLLESELFGYERGAFTSAQHAKPGQIELAAGGVLFLDEITEMSVPAQAKLLRVLQEREFQRLGATRVLQAHVRVIAATNRDLRKAVQRGDFREDLYYRLQVFEIHIPPLRERRADILLLGEAFLQEIGKSFGRAPAGLTRPAREALLQYEWPGNVRELRNALERAAILCGGGLIDTEHLSLERASRPPVQATTDLNDIERETIARVLRECRWNKSRAAQRLGLSRTQLYGRMRKYGLEPPPIP